MEQWQHGMFGCMLFVLREDHFTSYHYTQIPNAVLYGVLFVLMHLGYLWVASCHIPDSSIRLL